MKNPSHQNRAKNGIRTRPRKLLHPDFFLGRAFDQKLNHVLDKNLVHVLGPNLNQKWARNFSGRRDEAGADPLVPTLVPTMAGAAHLVVGTVICSFFCKPI